MPGPMTFFIIIAFALASSDDVWDRMERGEGSDGASPALCKIVFALIETQVAWQAQIPSHRIAVALTLCNFHSF